MTRLGKLHEPATLSAFPYIAPTAMSCDIRIGTSGYHYKHWVGPFYPPRTPPARMLEHYVRQFDTLELNNSFYRLPTVQAFESWRDCT
ncbi:MAG: DUF72 domain-containing protein, partial [Candidatus Angelobacter sp.]